MASKRTLTALEHLEVARRHLEDHVQLAWDDPVDWDDLALYGFYCLEAAVMAASAHVGWEIRGQHQEKSKAAVRLAREHGLPEIEELLMELNDGRKAVAYGDLDMPDLVPEEVVAQIEAFIEAVGELLGGADS